MDVLWFPQRLHTKLSIDGDVYNGTHLEYGNDGTLDAFLKQSEVGHKNFYRFQINLTESEWQKAKASIDEDHPTSYHTCSLGATRPLRQAGLFSVPGILNAMPAQSAMYLSALHLVGHPRVKEVSYHGNKEWSRTYDAAFFFEMACFLTMGFFIIPVAMYALMMADFEIELD